RAAHLDRSVQLDAGAPDRFGGVDGRGDPRFHVTRSAAEDLAVLDAPGERIDRPPGARRDDVEVAVEVNERPFAASAAMTDDVDARMFLRVLRPAFGGEVVHVESARREAPADELRAFRVAVARR